MCFLYPSCRGFIDLDGPVGMVLTADRDTREPAISQTQLAHYPRHMTTAALSQQRGRVVTALSTSRRGEEEENREGRGLLGCMSMQSKYSACDWAWVGPALTEYFSVVSEQGILVTQKTCGTLTGGLNYTKHMF